MCEYVLPMDGNAVTAQQVHGITNYLKINTNYIKIKSLCPHYYTDIFLLNDI